jgi:hypothetical protein
VAIFIARRGEVFFNLTEQRLVSDIYSLSKDSIISHNLEVLSPTCHFQILRPNEEVAQLTSFVDYTVDDALAFCFKHVRPESYLRVVIPYFLKGDRRTIRDQRVVEVQTLVKDLRYVLVLVFWGH